MIKRRTLPRFGFRGTTLIEAMVALTVLAFGLLAFSTALVGSATVDQYENARAYAANIAQETLAMVQTWSQVPGAWGTDPRLQPNASWTTSTPDFATPTVTAGAPMINPGTPPTINESLSTAPDFCEKDAGSGITCTSQILETTTPFGGRTLTTINTTYPGSAWIFNRYLNVMADPNNPGSNCLRIVAVLVTYSKGDSQRGLVSAYTAIFNPAALIPNPNGASNC